MKMTNKLPYQSIALCGYRRQGQEIYKKLMDAGVKIPYVIERNYQSLSSLDENTHVKIVGFGESKEFYSHAEALLLTGDLPEAIVREALEFAGIEVPVITDIEV